MDDNITTLWKGNLIFESLNPNQSTLTLGSGPNKEDNISDQSFNAIFSCRCSV